MVANKLQINFVLRYLSPILKLMKLFLLKTSGYKLFKNIYRRCSEKCARYGRGRLLNVLFILNRLPCVQHNILQMEV